MWITFFSKFFFFFVKLLEIKNFLGILILLLIFVVKKITIFLNFDKIKL
jgi:hypothetical protein